jgi:hypothetical protein
MANILSRTTKASLDEKGLNLSAGGMSIKTDKRMDRESYLDATQRYIFYSFEKRIF